MSRTQRSFALLLVLLSASGGALAADPCAYAHASEHQVRTNADLVSALAAARPGTLIRLLPGTYQGRFRIGSSGTANAPIILCGPRTAILDGGNANKDGYVLHLEEADRWILSGFTVTRGREGVMLTGAGDNVLTGLEIHSVGQAAIHLRRFSRNNRITYNTLHDTGRFKPGYGEGVYIGTAYSQWEAVTGSAATHDASDGTLVRYNTFGPNVTAEAVDAKEGTSNGRILDNAFDGDGMSGVNAADSWVDVKGNGYLVTGNTGVRALQDGFQVHAPQPGWGRSNTFADNVANVQAGGYGFFIAAAARSAGNVVRCDNVVRNAADGFANVGCTR